MIESKVPAHLAPYIDVLGTERAVALFLELGGSQVYLAGRRSGERALAARIIGKQQVTRLAAALGDSYIKVPLARRWVASVLRDQGKSDNEIARLIRADIATVRRWLGPKPDADQLSLLL